MEIPKKIAFSQSGGASERIFGIIKKIVFKSDTSFQIIILTVSKSGQEITAKGQICPAAPGQAIWVSGDWVDEKNYGRQFRVADSGVQVPVDAAGIEKYLCSGFFHGIGPVFAAKLVAAFGARTLEILEEGNVQAILRIPGIGKKRAEAVVAAYGEQKEISDIMAFLRGREIPVHLARKIYLKFGRQCVDKILINPYELALAIEGVGFLTADKIAGQVGFSLTDPRRLSAATLFVLSQELKAGSLYVEQAKLKTQTQKLLASKDDGKAEPAQEYSLEPILKSLIEEKKVVSVVQEQNTFLGLEKAYAIEKSLARKIVQIQESAAAHNYSREALYRYFSGATIDRGKDSANQSASLSAEQLESLCKIFDQKISVITGGPGTGKTTILKALVGFLKKEKIRFALAAPTGKAARRMAEKTFFQATTIHRLLEFDPSTGRFARRATNQLTLDFLVVDETSMLDVFLANSTLGALSHQARVLFVGDSDQLPSVGPGNFLADLKNSGRASRLELTTVFRQSAESAIVQSAHKIRIGEIPSFIRDTKVDYQFISVEDAANLPRTLEDIVKTTLPQWSVNRDQWIVLSPMHRGQGGSISINRYLQRLSNPLASNPTANRVSHFGQEFFVGDPIMQIKNNYDTEVFNGETGTILEIKPDRTLVLDFDKKRVELASHNIGQISLAYCASIHKSQGSEFKAVTIPIFMEHFMLLQRNLIYTAVTRARKLCTIVGQKRALAMAIKSQKGLERITFLKDFLKDQ